jgi:hypothetical protein
MKKILKFVTFIIAICLVNVSCESEESNFDSIKNEYNPSASKYYVQFKEASKSLQTGIDAQGDLVDIETTIKVSLLGAPQASDLTINLAVDPATTIDASMYEFSSSSITIPAGKTSGSITLTTNTALMPIGEVLNLKLNIDAGENNATAGTTLSYDLERIKFCLKTLLDYVGTWSGKDSWGYTTQVTTSIDGDGDLVMNGIGFGWMQNDWGEPIVSSTPVKVDVNLITGTFTIDPAKQTGSYLETTYLGAPQAPYNISGSGKITSTCDQVLEFTYYYIQGGSPIKGSSYGPEFKEVITLN